MVIQKTLDNLKEKPKEDKKVIAGGIAFAVVVVLFFAWAFFFFKKIQHGSQTLQLGGSQQDEFNFSNVREAQQKLQQDTSDLDELRASREQTGVQDQQGASVENQNATADPFASPGGY